MKKAKHVEQLKLRRLIRDVLVEARKPSRYDLNPTAEVVLANADFDAHLKALAEAIVQGMERAEREHESPPIGDESVDSGEYLKTTDWGSMASALEKKLHMTILQWLDVSMGYPRQSKRGKKW